MPQPSLGSPVNPAERTIDFISGAKQAAIFALRLPDIARCVLHVITRWAGPLTSDEN